MEVNKIKSKQLKNPLSGTFTGSFVGDLQGTSSFATTSSYSLTSSFSYVDLQQVTDNGNTTTNSIWSTSNYTGTENNLHGFLIGNYNGNPLSKIIADVSGNLLFYLKGSEFTWRDINGNDLSYLRMSPGNYNDFQLGNLTSVSGLYINEVTENSYLYLGNNAYTAKIKSDNISADRNLLLPNNNGTLTLSVNNNFADNAGNIEISGTSENLNQVLINGNESLGQDIILTEPDRIVVGVNRAGLGKGTFDTVGNKGVSLYCAAGFQLNYQAGYLRHTYDDISGIILPLYTDSELIYSNDAPATPTTGRSLVDKDYVNNTFEPVINAGTSLQYWRGDKTWQTLNTSIVPELTNLYYTEARVNANTNVAANTAARHNAVTLGTANGLSLSTQILSLAVASTSVTGALTSTDWNTFNSKENVLTFSTGLSRIGNTITNTITQYTDTLARLSLSFTAGSGAYNSTTGVITIPTDNSQITNGAGYLTSSTASTTYFPLTGGSLTGTAGAGFHGFIAQSSTPSTPTSGFRLYANSSNAFSWIGQNGFTRTFDGTSNNANRIYTLPNRDITFDNITTSTTSNGTGFIKSNGTNITFDNSTYLTSVNLATNVTGILPIANGGTGSATQNFVDISSNQTSLAGNKSWTGFHTYSGTSLTGSQSTSLLDLSQTWNTTGNPTAILLNVTTTASGSSSKLIDLQTSSRGSVFSVNPQGGTILGSGGAVTALTVNSNNGTSLIVGNNIMQVPATIIPIASQLLLTPNWVGSTNNANGIVLGNNGYNSQTSSGECNVVFGNMNILSQLNGICNYVKIAPIINITNANVTTTCATRGFFYSPTITSLGISRHIAWENTTGDSLFGTTSGSVGIGANTSINSSAILDITSTTKGFLMPRMTTTQKNAIASPATGLEVFDTTLSASSLYNGSAWGVYVDSVNNQTSLAGNKSWTGKHIFNPSVSGAASSVFDINGTTAATANLQTLYGLKIVHTFSQGGSSFTSNNRVIDISSTNSQLIFGQSNSLTTYSAAADEPTLFINRTSAAGGIANLFFLQTGAVYGGIKANYSSGEIRFGAFINGGYYSTIYSNNTEVARFSGTNTSPLVGIGVTSPTAYLHLKAGTNSANNAPFKISSSSGVVLATPENGAFEYDGTNLFFTRAGGVRETNWCGNAGATAPSTAGFSVATNFYGSSMTNILGTPNSWASVVIAGVTYKIPLYS